MVDLPDYSTQEIVRSLNKLEATMTEKFADLKQDVQRLEDNYVTRGEFELYKEATDRELKQIKEANRPVKSSGWTIAAVVISALVGGGSLLTTFITLIQVVQVIK